MTGKNFDEGFDWETRDPEDPTKTVTLLVSRAERAKAERSFIIGGETFHHRIGVPPEVLQPWLEADEFSSDWLTILDETIVAMLEPGEEDLWKKVRDPNAANPLTQIDLTALIRWLIEVTAGRPTGPPSNSSDGRPSTETRSTDGSSSPVPAVSAA